jgi:TonB-dependent receptor
VNTGFGNGLEASWRLNYTWTDNTADNPAEIRFRSASAFATRPTVVYDFRDTSSNFVALYTTGGTSSARTQGPLVRNIESFAMPLQQISSFESAEITSAYTAKVDFDYHTDLFGHATKVEFGGLYTTRIKRNAEYDYTLASVTGNTLTYSQLAQDGPYLGKQYLGYDFRYTNKDKVLETVALSRGAAPLVFNTTNYWKVGEKISAGYLMATTQFDWGNLVYGARVEQIQNTGEAYATLGVSGTSLVSVKSEETLVYPSVHVNYNLRENVKLRVGLTTSASRPDYDDMRPNLVIDDTNDTISGGNPAAKPEKQVGLDAYVEWYMAPEGFVSAGLFYKDIKDVLMKQTSTFGLTNFDTSTDVRSTYAFTSIQNGGKGHLQGFEVFYSGTAREMVRNMNAPEWMEGFGVKLSGTWTSSEVQTPVATGVVSRKIPLLGTSDAVYKPAGHLRTVRPDGAPGLSVSHALGPVGRRLQALRRDRPAGRQRRHLLGLG